MTTYGSVCSGIEAASVAWEPLGWQPAWFAEIEPFPCAVLAHHWPHVPNHGDMTRLASKVLSGSIPAPDVLVGGTPCQAFSVAGMRSGLADPRGALTIKYVELADAVDHVRASRGDAECVIVWENVPGVLSDKGNAFGCFLGALVGESDALQPSGGKWTDAGCVHGPVRSAAWRVLDAQYFGLAQRRRRVFVVASARNGFDPASVLFEFDGLRRDIAPSREAGEGAAAGTVRSTDDGSDVDHARAGHLQPVAPTLLNNGKAAGSATQQDAENGALIPVCVTGDITHTLKAEGFDASEDGTGRGQPIIAFSAKDYGGDAQADLSPTLRAGGHADSHANAGVMPAVAYAVRTAQTSANGHGIADEVSHTLDQANGQAVAYSVALRGREGGATAELGDDVAGCLRASSGGGDKQHVLAPVAIGTDCYNGAITGDIACTMGRPGSSVNASGPTVLTVHGTQDPDIRHDQAHTLGRNSGQENAVLAYTTKLHNTKSNQAGKFYEDYSPSLGASSPAPAVAYAFHENQRAEITMNNIAGTVKCAGGKPGQGYPAAMVGMAVRRLTPRECERLQGFPDSHTNVPYRGKPAADGPRYKAIGNSKAINVVRWLGRRIDRALTMAQEAA